jgi:DNA polymerase elongation subunit (family B)
MSKPRILLLDIETSYLLVKAWRLGENHLSLEQMEEDSNILSWSAKWEGEDNVMYQDLRGRDPRNDKPLMKGVWKLLDEADIVVTQNGKRFDIPRLNARFIVHGFKPPSSYRQIDTLELAKRRFGFTSNKLAYMTEKLNKKFKKLAHKKFPGLDLWSECMKGNLKAWKEMETYNKYDVLALEELYNTLKAWGIGINMGAYSQTANLRCACGKLMDKKGFYYTQSGKFQRYRCTACGSQTYSGKNLLGHKVSKEIRS